VQPPHGVGVGEDLDRLLERLEVLGGEQDGGGLPCTVTYTRSCCPLTRAISLDRCAFASARDRVVLVRRMTRGTSTGQFLLIGE
jgi:hypothetical protein